MHPILIATVALVGLPILLHLIMRQEPKRLVFPAVRFLQQKRRINQRKMRLRHLLLLLLRMLLIALFGLALFQPTLFSETFQIHGEQPVAAVFVLDTSPSMGYKANDRTRLDEARRRALELLDDLPRGSKVAVLDPADPGGTWEPTADDARRKLEELKEPKGAAVPVTTALATAYQLLRTVDQESESPEPMPRLVAVFSDRTAACWDATRTDDLAKLRDAVPQPAVAHLFVDVGIDQPADVGITGVELKPQIVPRGQPVVLTATVAAAGPGVMAEVKLRVATVNLPEQTKHVAVPAGASAAASFEIDGRQLQPGLYQAEVRLTTPDNLEADNVRYVTFRIAEPKKILTLADDPPAAEFWKESHAAVREFECEVRKPDDPKLSFDGYEAVCLLSVADPSPLWPKLQAYVAAGGKLLIMPGGDSSVAAYTSEPALRLLPGGLQSVVETPPMQPGAAWLPDDAALRHPMLKAFRDWKLRGNVDVIVDPRRAWKYWAVSPTDGSIVVSYDDAENPKDRHPAVLERAVGAKGGKVVLLTTRMDITPEEQKWNNYWDLDGHSWGVVFPNLLMRYLVGDPTDANFNFATGQPVPVPLPKGELKKGASLRFEGPGVSGRDAEIPVGENQAELRLPPAKTATAGNYRVSTPDGKWQDGFSLNPPADEASLEKVPAEAIEGQTTLFGPGSVIPVGKDIRLREALDTKFNQPVDLFPWLLIAVLLLVALEGVAANRFYRS